MFDLFAKFDIKVFHALFSLHSPALNAVVKTITQLGDAGLVWIALIFVFLLFRKTRKIGVAMAAALLLHLLCNELILKSIFGRPRPFNYKAWQDAGLYVYPNIVPKPTSTSFPSGHTCSSFAVATALFCGRKKWGVPALVLAALVGFSRVYCGVHYCTDVLAGMIEGVLLGIAAWFLINALLNRLKAKKPDVAKYFEEI